ncbi:MAG: hypothetical protein ABFQ62_04500 [Patescibacteria group bacterium]
MKKIFLLSFFTIVTLFIAPQIFAGPQDQNNPKKYVGDQNTSGFSLGDKFSLGKNPMPVAKVYNTPAELMNVIVRNLFVIAGVIFFIMILYSGFKLVRDDKKGVEEAKNIMTVAVAGFIIMFAAYWIVQIIEVLTGVSIIL